MSDIAKVFDARDGGEFCVGHRLSYTSFSFSNLEVHKTGKMLNVSVTVTNARGERVRKSCKFMSVKRNRVLNGRRRS